MAAGWPSIITDTLEEIACFEPSAQVAWVNALIRDMIESKASRNPPASSDILRVHRFGLAEGWAWDSISKRFNIPKEG